MRFWLPTFGAVSGSFSYPNLVSRTDFWGRFHRPYFSWRSRDSGGRPPKRFPEFDGPQGLR